MRATPTLTAGFGLTLVALAAGGITAHAQKSNGGSPLPKPPAQTQPQAQTPPPGAGGVAFTMGEIGRRAAYGQDGSWLTKATDDGALVFANTGSPTEWDGTIIQPPRFPYTIQVEVNSGIAPSPGHAVGAGIIFAYQRSDDPKQRAFYAVLLSGDTVYAYRYDGSFSQVVRNTTTDLAGGRRWSTLRVTVRQDGFALALNGQEFTSMSADGPLTGEVGVMASGAGDAAFRNLKLQ